MHELYPRIYAMLKRKGHNAAHAIQIMYDARRGNRFSLRWIKILRCQR